MNSADFLDDIPLDAARLAHRGTSHVPEQRAKQERDDYARTLAADYDMLAKYAGTDAERDRLADEFAEYRVGYRARYLDRLSAMSRCLSTMIAGGSKFPVCRAQKASDLADKRTAELIEYRERALVAIRKAIRPDLAPIMAGDADAPERLRARLADAEAHQEQMKRDNLAARGSHPAFALRNNGAEIRRLKARIAEVDAARSATGETFQGAHARYEDAPADNRVRLYYPGKPDAATRARLKSGGFRWTPSIEAWQAYRNPRAIEIAKREAGPVAAPAAHGCTAPDRTAPCPSCSSIAMAPSSDPEAASSACACIQSTPTRPTCGCPINAPEADHERYACPCGDHCTDPTCIAIASERASAAELAAGTGRIMDPARQCTSPAEVSAS